MALLSASTATTRFASTSSSTIKIDRKLSAFSPRGVRTSFKIQSFFNPFEDKPIIKDAVKEPVAFLGGMFAGLLRLDLNEDPLKEWIARTVESAGIKPDEVESTVDGSEDLPQQIEIE